jgi:hypothetical protein
MLGFSAHLPLAEMLHLVSDAHLIQPSTLGSLPLIHKEQALKPILPGILVDELE